MHPAGLLNSSTGADVIVPSKDDMSPGSPETSLDGKPAETSDSATAHTIPDDPVNSSTATTSTTSSGSTATTTTATATATAGNSIIVVQ